MGREKKKVYCDHCADEIKSKEDLVITYQYTFLSVYHNECFASEIKSLKGAFLSNRPLNGTFANVIFTCMGILLLIALIMDLSLWPIVAIGLILPGIKLYSYFAYERHLK